MFHSANGVSVDIQLPVGTHQYMFEVDGVKKTDPANTMVRKAMGDILKICIQLKHHDYKLQCYLLVFI